MDLHTCTCTKCTCMHAYKFTWTMNNINIHVHVHVCIYASAIPDWSKWLHSFNEVRITDAVGEIADMDNTRRKWFVRLFKAILWIKEVLHIIPYVAKLNPVGSMIYMYSSHSCGGKTCFLKLIQGYFAKLQ